MNEIDEFYLCDYERSDLYKEKMKLQMDQKIEHRDFHP